jgi:hypothetical protein
MNVLEKLVPHALNPCRVRRAPAARVRGASKPARWASLHSVLPLHFHLASGAGVLVALLGLACKEQDLSRDYELIVKVSSDPGRGLAGARASVKGRELGVSDSSGAVAIHVRGHEGDVMSIDIACPSGHRPPAPVRVPLRHVSHDVKPEFAALCTPLSHSIVVAVRAERGPHLPLLHLGRELARTDASGAAHVLLDVASDDVVELVLDTSEQPRLRPKNPMLRIQPGRQDEITAISQEFTLQPAARVRKVTEWRGPTRID